MGAAAIEVQLRMVVTVKLMAEDATEAELLRHVERCKADVEGAAVALCELRSMFGEREAGYLDEDRAVFATEIIGADPLAGALEVVR